MSLDPDAARLLETIRLSGRPSYDQMTPEEARAAYRAAREAVSPEPQPVASVDERSAPGPGGPIRVRIYRPLGSGPAPLPLLVYFHGGGWVLGDLDSHDGVCRHLAHRGRCVLVSVDYRLAPEHRFPAAIEDAFAATRWAAQQAVSFGADPERVAVGGDSAGGTLAAVVSLLARDAGAPKLCYQALLYPVTDLGMSAPSQERLADGFLLTRATQLWFQSHYLSRPEDRDDWRASPLRAPNLAGLPPALVVTAGYDPLCDEAEHYARRLVEAEVPVTSWRIAGQIHGFLPMGKVLSAAGPVLDGIGRMLHGALTEPV